MKEIIYLDTDILNSMLAQLDEGIVKSFSFEENSQEEESEENVTTRGKDANVGGHLKLSTGFFPGGELKLGANLGNSGNETIGASKTILEGQKDILNKAFHDYALDILQLKLAESDLLATGPDFSEGDIHLGEDKFKFYDFNLMKNVMDSARLQEIMLFREDSPISNLTEALEIIERKKKGKMTAKDQSKIHHAEKIEETNELLLPVINTFKMLETFFTYATNAFGETTIIKAGNKVGFLKKEFLRDSPEALSFRTDKTRHVKFLVRIIGVKEFVYSDSVMSEFNPEDVDQFPNIIFDLLLGPLGIIKVNDVLVSPIAIYFE